MNLKEYPIWTKELQLSKEHLVTTGGHQGLLSRELLPNVYWQGSSISKFTLGAPEYSCIVREHNHPEEEIFFQLAQNGYFARNDMDAQVAIVRSNEKHGGKGYGFWLSLKANNIEPITENDKKIYRVGDLEYRFGKNLMDKNAPDGFKLENTVFVTRELAKANVFPDTRLVPHLYVAVRER